MDEAGVEVYVSNGQAADLGDAKAGPQADLHHGGDRRVRAGGELPAFSGVGRAAGGDRGDDALYLRARRNGHRIDREFLARNVYGAARDVAFLDPPLVCAGEYHQRGVDG